MKIYKVEINGRTFDIIQDTDGKFIRPEVNGGSALKPANEPICLARKPLSEKTIVDNVIKWGTGGININGCRIGTDGGTKKVDIDKDSNTLFEGGRHNSGKIEELGEGRFPANILFDEEAAQILDEQSGILKSGDGKSGTHKINRNGDTNGVCKMDMGKSNEAIHYGDKGGASRFFYVAKVGKKERNLGLDNFEDKEKEHNTSMKCGNCNLPILSGTGKSCKCEIKNEVGQKVKNNHPTLKPINLMNYLCRLITPPGGIVLDPFMGSGSTGISACLEGFRFVGMELDEDYFKIAEARINSYEEYRKLLK
jgi:site-specific DNA-methyltransferase (adenine-specific)